jgi:hypothetical protein
LFAYLHIDGYEEFPLKYPLLPSLTLFFEKQTKSSEAKFTLNFHKLRNFRFKNLASITIALENQFN